MTLPRDRPTRLPRGGLFGGLLGLLASCTASGGRQVPPAGTDGDSADRARAEIGALLDSLHACAARADGEAYFALFAPDALYVGTDATEHWTLDEFRAYAMPYFSSGRGWDYRVGERRIALGPAGLSAWFVERLHNDKYGATRGSGALERDPDGRWRIAQYVLSFPVPNGLAAELVESIRAAESRP